MAMRRAIVMIAISLTLAACGSTSAAGSQAHSQSGTAGADYLALGDSVTFGFREPGTLPPPDYHDAASLVGYPELLGAQLHLRVTNAACPGETSSSLIDPLAQSFGCENELGNAPSKPEGYRTEFPLHVHYRGSQLAFALSFLRTHGNVQLVSLMIGANDLFLCAKSTHDECASSAEREAAVKTLSGNVERILSAIRERAHYRGTLAIVNYYSLDYATPEDNLLSMTVDRTVDAAASSFHVVIAEGYGAFEHAAAHFGGDTCAAGLLTKLKTPGTCGIHPSRAGQLLLARTLARAIGK
jgi:lysophospholipase L1-like esterase